MLIYLILVNAAGFVFMLADKLRAKNDQWRIPERVLLGIGLAGGSIGCIAGMRLFRHKTRKPLFSIGLPVILAVQVLACIFIFS